MDSALSLGIARLGVAQQVVRGASAFASRNVGWQELLHATLGFHEKEGTSQHQSLQLLTTLLSALSNW
jgi:hypothetical protein